VPAQVADGDWGFLGTLLGFLSIPLLVGLNAFFVAAEFALVAVRKTRIEELVARKVTSARAVASAIEHLNRTIAATQLGVTLASLGLGWVAESILAQAIADWVAGLPTPWAFITRHSIAGTIAFLLVTFFHVVLGELFPKTLALQAPDRIALWVARPLNVFVTLTRPLTIFMTGTANLLIRTFGFRATAGMVHSVEELALLIEDTEEAGILDPDQAELVQNVFRLTKKSVADCMVPREKMAALELTAPPERVLEAVRSGAHTRMPVYSGELDNIVGIVNTKNLFFLLSLRGVVVLEDAIYPPLFLKPDEEIANGLRLFKKAKRPMALVRNDDGKIVGLITLEDILEEIIGDIEDEHDRPIPRETRLKGVRRRRRRV
jgi:CBS domain containing-hemolysin-like protein